MTSAPQDIRESVRARYAAAATTTSCCGGAPADLDRDAAGTLVFGASLYDGAEAGPDAGALAGSLGCGVPTAVADLHPGEVVLDLGSGAGGDVLIAARRVGPTGRAIGLDMTEEMLELARANAKAAGVANVEFVRGYLEDIPLPDDAVDVVISNCVLNLAADKAVVLAQAARVLRPGGRLAFSDVIADPGMDAATKADMAAWTGCIAGALSQEEFTAALAGAGFTDVEIRPTHRVHPAGFPGGHFHLAEEAVEAGLTGVEVHGLEGPGGLALDISGSHDPDLVATAAVLAQAFATAPGRRDLSPHLLVIGCVFAPTP